LRHSPRIWGTPWAVATPKQRGTELPDGASLAPISFVRRDSATSPQLDALQKRIVDLRDGRAPTECPRLAQFARLTFHPCTRIPPGSETYASSRPPVRKIFRDLRSAGPAQKTSASLLPERDAPDPRTHHSIRRRAQGEDCLSWTSETAGAHQARPSWGAHGSLRCAESPVWRDIWHTQASGTSLLCKSSRSTGFPAHSNDPGNLVPRG
jgi:hypothetical protein